MVELKAGRLRCELAPGLGGSVAGLWLDDIPVLRSTPAAQLASARLSGCYPLVPFSNRIGQASLVWQGTQHPLVRNNGDEPHAIHGVGWQRPWSELDSDATSAMLAYEHRPDAAWPFAFDCSHTFRLRPNALEMTLALTNQSDRPAPAGLGWHPYFDKRPGSHIAFRATGRWEMGPDKLPTQRVASSGADADCTALEVDHCYDGWDGAVTLHDDRLRVRVVSPLTRVVVFNSASRPYLAIEPVSHVNNAVHLYAAGAPADALGLTVLQPGESMMAQMAIEVEPA
ncbi:MAG TPA: aldose 1-epimerase [Ramlibacter sp.]|jgi:aldose 1-epimerase